MKASTSAQQPLPLRVGELALWGVVLLAPLVIYPWTAEAFRLPKLIASEALGLISLLGLSWRLRQLERVDLRGLLAQPVVQLVLPLLGISVLGLMLSDHRPAVLDGLWHLTVAAACLLGWTWGLPADKLRARLYGFVLTALLLTPLAVAQFAGWAPLDLVNVNEGHRLGVTSLVGNPGDLGAFLVLPCLLVQHALWRGRRRFLWLLALGSLLAALAISQSLTAFSALAAGSAVLWFLLLPRRRFLALLAAAAVGGMVLFAALPALRLRVEEKARAVRKGDLNELLTGRLDGWYTAAWMLRQHPQAGIGLGAYRLEFAAAKIALSDRGTRFLWSNPQPVFANAHNEYLEAAAEWGLPGVLAMLWAAWLLLRQLRKLGAASRSPGGRRKAAAVSAEDAALAAAGLVVWAVLALTFFPFRIALTGFQALVFLAWMLRLASEVEPA